MKRLIAICALACFLMSCGLSEDKFAEKSLDATCSWLVECNPEFFPDVDACKSASSSEDPPADCEYDKKKAKECVDALEALTCDDTEVPSACADVYDCPTSSNNTNSVNNMNSVNNTADMGGGGGDMGGGGGDM